MNKLFFTLLCLTSASFAQDATFKGPSKVESNLLFVSPITDHSRGFQNQDSFRLQLGVTPVGLETELFDVSFLDSEAMLGVTLAKKEIDLNRFRSTLLRFKFAKIINPMSVGTFYRDTDRAIDYGLDILSIRFPIAFGDENQIIVKPGLDLGVKHYQSPIDDIYLSGAASIDFQAKVDLIENWLGAGLLASIRYDLDTSKMSGFRADQTIYLSLVLVDDKLYTRIYAGVDEQPVRDNIGLPSVNFFSGAGILGVF